MCALSTAKEWMRQEEMTLEEFGGQWLRVREGSLLGGARFHVVSSREEK